MKPISPVIPGAGAVEKVIAESHADYQSLPSFRTEIASISRWKLSDAERAHIAAGGDLFVAQLNFGGSIQPLLPLAMPEDDVLPTVLAVEEELHRRHDV